jgi:hypothetical protein
MRDEMSESVHCNLIDNSCNKMLSEVGEREGEIGKDFRKTRTFEDLELTFGDAITDEKDVQRAKTVITEFNDCFALSNSELT